MVKREEKATKRKKKCKMANILEYTPPPQYLIVKQKYDNHFAVIQKFSFILKNHYQKSLTDKLKENVSN